ncbi:hypothetical protein EV643_1333 [Kribbella sp. VKM Ac-2527]|uniref:Uncharacterized protein n=2 Tax=Kribbella caucasensis TaxID=2512215 RepID=A0A4R6JF55_9ACTN|nr:hypothetical protein EV643_1333 [Kribbella sp. VKM Ac-2527]
MLRVYLDQNKWVDLARAAVGHPLGEPFQDALAMCRAAVQSGIVSFPLDMYRYWETSKRGSDRSRNEVVDVMRELSRQHTMAVPVAVLDHELDLALQRRYGRPARPREQKVFGVGLRHIAGDRMEWPELDLSRHPQVAAALPPGVRAQLDNAFCEYLEEYLLRAGPTTYRGLGFDRADSNHAERFVEFENKLSAAIQQRGLTGDAIDIAVRAADFGDIKPAIIAALQNIGMTYEQFEGSLTARGLLQFMDDLPTRYVTNVLRSAKHRQTQQKWEPNDFTDIVAPEAVKIFEAGWLGIH